MSMQPPGSNPHFPAPGSFDYNVYREPPVSTRGYTFRTRIEISYLVVNVGVRFDYFQPDGTYLINPDLRPWIRSRLPYPSEYSAKASVKTQVSPHIGLSYPISNKGAAVDFSVRPLLPDSAVRKSVQESKLPHSY